MSLSFGAFMARGAFNAAALRRHAACGAYDATHYAADIARPLRDASRFRVSQA